MAKTKVHPSIYAAIEVRYSDFNHPLSSFDTGEARINTIDEMIKKLEEEKMELISRLEWRKNQISVLKDWLDSHEPEEITLNASAVSKSEIRNHQSEIE